jgi:hypothetical protein
MQKKNCAWNCAQIIHKPDNLHTDNQEFTVLTKIGEMVKKLS